MRKQLMVDVERGFLLANQRAVRATVNWLLLALSLAINVIEVRRKRVEKTNLSAENTPRANYLSGWGVIPAGWKRKLLLGG